MNKGILAVFGALFVLLVVANCVRQGDGNPAQPHTGAPNQNVVTVVPTSTVEPSPWPTPSPRQVNTGGVPRGLTADLAKVDRKDPQAVGLAFTAALFTQDALVDQKPTDPGKRAAVLATTQLNRELLETPSARGDANWNKLVDTNGYVTVETTHNTEEGMPKNTPTLVYDSYLVDITQHPDNATYSYLIYMLISLNPITELWEISEYKLDTA